MKAIRFHEFGGPEVLKLEDVPDPTPGDGEVLIQVQHAGVNPTDINTRSGGANYPPSFAFPAMLGREAAGIVAAVGSGVTSVAAGDRVVARNTAYGYAEQITAPEANVFKLPDNLGSLEAAVIPVTYATAWDAVVNRTQVQAGQTVLVQGAAGGVGIAAVQIAKSIGATVIGVAGTDEKLAWVKSQGADHGVNHTAGSIADQVKEITGGKGVDAIIDGVAGKPFEDAFNALNPGGRIAVYGVAAGREVTVNLALLFRIRASLLGSGSSGTDREQFAQIVQLHADGKLHSTIDRTWPLGEASAAQQHITSRQVMGKVALVIG